MSGNVYKRGEIYYIRFTFRGQEFRESAKSTNRKVAGDLLRQRQREAAEGRITGPRAERVRFDDLVMLIRADYAANGRKSLGSLDDRIELLRQTFGDIRPVDVTYAMLAQYRDKRLVEKARPATVRYELVVFTRMFTLAIRAGLLSTKPLRPEIRVENARRGFFEAEDLARVLKQLPEHLRPAIVFAYVTGWRVGEVRKLTWNRHVDAKEGLVRLDAHEVKNAQGKVFPFRAHPELAKVITQQIERVQAMQRGHGQIIPWLFPRPDGRQLGQFHKEWTKACRAARLPNKMVHDLRRTAVRNLVRAGVTERVAMALAGFKTRAVFDRYNIVSEADLAHGVAKLAKHSSRA